MTFTDTLPDGNDFAQFMNTESEAHSFQDGAVFAVIVALFLLQSDLIVYLAMLLGLGGAKAGRRAILRSSTDLLRTDDITDAPEYAILGFVIVFVLTYGGGLVARTYLLGLV